MVYMDSHTDAEKKKCSLASTMTFILNRCMNTNATFYLFSQVSRFLLNVLVAIVAILPRVSNGLDAPS